MKCDHKGYEYVAGMARRIWKCARCRRVVPAPVESTAQKIVRAFKDGLSRGKVARRFNVPVAVVDEALRKALR